MTDEREKIVAWLRNEADWQLSMKAVQATAALTLAADQIEHGDHLVWKPEPTIPVEQWITQPSVGH